ncbi:MAG: hypothetical protein IPO88_10795 [Nannocystis sp.]|uniref:HEAT repeat domain-containing protein n=1 Tax=Nannocystis sp. TaxID=1962667 RepID=UPI002427BE0D|nr:HEAT repeat domain-containing protein [Nannocystis sp.]MBK9753976.1 hypothetical protein [Nannocystis sp.]
MSAVPVPDLAALLARLDRLSFSERLREAAAFARDRRSDPGLPAAIERLLADDAHAAELAVVMARANQLGAPLQLALTHRSQRVRRLAIDALVHLADHPAQGPDLAALALELPLALRRVLLKALVRGGQRVTARRLFPGLLARSGPREAAVLLPVLEDSTLRAHLPALAHAVGSWRSLYLHHPRVVVDHLDARLTAAAPREQPAIWIGHRGLVSALAELGPAALLDLLDRHGDSCPASLLWARLGELARVDPERSLAWLERPEPRAWALRAGLPRGLLNRVVALGPAHKLRLARLLGEQPERLAPLLKVVAPGQREALFTAAFAGQGLAARVWPDVLLDSLPRALQRREAARMLALPLVRADPERGQALAAYLAPSDAEATLLPTLRAADAELRGRAVARVIACAGRDGRVAPALALLAPRLRNDQDPVRLQAFTALARVPVGAFVDADADALRAVVVAATEARDTSYATRQQIQQLAFRLLRGHAERAGEGLFQAGLDLLGLLAGQTGTLQLPDLSRGLPRRSAPAIVAALAARITAANQRDRPELVLGLAAALGRRRFGLQALTELLTPLTRKQPVGTVAGRAIVLLLADPQGRDDRVRELIAWDPSVITLQPVLMHLHRRHQAWLDPFLDGTPLKGRFVSGATIYLLPVHNGFHRWLPRQQRAFLRLLVLAASDRKHPSHSRAAILGQIARLPIVDAALLAPFVASDEVPIAEAALGALAWLDAPAEALPLLLANLDGDRARVAMYALPRVARYLDGAVLAAALLELIAGPGRKVTVRKEALRLLGEHRSPASVPALQAALARPDLHKDVAIAVGHAARNLLDDPRALEILARLAASPEPDIARSLLDPRPDLLPAPARPGYAALVRGLVRHPDLATRRAATRALPIWSSGQEATIADDLVATLLDLVAGDTWSDACAALVAVAADGRCSAALERAAASLAASADLQLPHTPATSATPPATSATTSATPPTTSTTTSAASPLAVLLTGDAAIPHDARDLPARQRLLALVAALRGQELARRLERRADLERVADALVADDLWPLAAGLRLAGLDLAATATAADALRTLAADARADAFLGELITCLSGQIDASSARCDPHALLALAAALAGAAAPAARLAVALVAAAGTRSTWPDAARDALTHLRAHADLRVRHAARQVFTDPEAPVLAL